MATSTSFKVNALALVYATLDQCCSSFSFKAEILKFDAEIDLFWSSLFVALRCEFSTCAVYRRRCIWLYSGCHLHILLCRSRMHSSFRPPTRLTIITCCNGSSFLAFGSSAAIIFLLADGQLKFWNFIVETWPTTGTNHHRKTFVRIWLLQPRSWKMFLVKQTKQKYRIDFRFERIFQYSGAATF